MNDLQRAAVQQVREQIWDLYVQRAKPGSHLGSRRLAGKGPSASVGFNPIVVGDALHHWTV